MTKLFRAGLMALLGFAVATPAALASKVVATPEKGHMTVTDDAHVFDKDSVIKAESKFHGITFKSPTHLTVVTVDKVPAEKKADFEKAKGDATARRKFMKDWVHEMAPVESERGVFVLVCQEARLLEVVADRQTDLKRHFGDSDAKHVADLLTAGMKSANDAKTEDEKRAIRGEALVKATDYVIGQLKNTSAAEATAGTHSDGGHETHKSGGMPWWGWVLIVAGVLLVIWMVVALIRAMTGNVYGGMYGGYGGGYGYGGGGPGFFGMFMGGMLGSMAGMWLYNSMMGTHYAHDPSAAAAGDFGGDAGPADTGAGDYDNGAEAGGDWGDNAGGDGGAGGDWGNDAGGGGGDWGGDGGGGDWGGDAGGGGDFGGGGDW